MIPLGNWEETNDELRNQIADLEDENAELLNENEKLQSALNAADTDISNYLFELDHLHHAYSGLELDVEGLLTLVEYWQEKAATAEAELGDAREALADLKTSYNEMYEDYSKVSYQLTEIHGLVAYGIPGDAVEFVRGLKNELEAVRLMNRDLVEENEEMFSENLRITREAHEEWSRANDLETSSISIEESRELTTRVMELEQENEELRALALEDDFDFWNTVDELDKVQTRANSWFEMAKGLVRENKDLEQENYDLADSYAEIAIANMELKKALRTLAGPESSNPDDITKVVNTFNKLNERR